MATFMYCWASVMVIAASSLYIWTTLEKGRRP
jgi:hypothetical protein